MARTQRFLSADTVIGGRITTGGEKISAAFSMHELICIAHLIHNSSDIDKRMGHKRQKKKT